MTRDAPRVTWLCRPDVPNDPCATADLSTTDILADGTRRVLPFVRPRQPPVDCFYVYPTVDMELVPGNHQDVEHVPNALATTLAQAARFDGVCALWVPIYRQATLGSWLQPAPERERRLAFAFADVERAFAAWLAGAHDRRVVLIGHSQGAEMVMRLLRRFFDADPALRARLVVALAVGGNVNVAAGTTTVRGLASIPLCSRPLQTGCVVAYRTSREGTDVDWPAWAPGPGEDTACVDPVALDMAGRKDDVHRLTRAYFPVGGVFGHALRGIGDVTTPFVSLPAFYEARCERTSRGDTFLAIAPARGGAPIDLDSPRLLAKRLGLHLIEMQLTQGDLIDLVERRAAASP